MRAAALALLLMPVLVLGEDAPANKEEAPAPSEQMRLQLKNGSILMGELAFPNIVVETAYGKLTVPTKDVVRLRVGKQSDPDLLAEIQQLVKDLGCDDAAARNKATESLAKLGRVALAELKEAAKSTDPEVKNRASTLVQEMENSQEDEAESLPEEDELVTVRFTVKGDVKLEKIDLKTSYGALAIPKKEVRVITFQRSHHEVKKLQVQCDAGVASPLNSQMFVHKGDKITVKAEGTVSFRNGGWEITPDGNTQYGNFQNFPMGSLVGRIGSSSNWFKVGGKWTGKAAKDGVLHLALAMNPEYLRMSSGNYEVTVEIGPEGE